jgi:hypothetical protein
MRADGIFAVELIPAIHRTVQNRFWAMGLCMSPGTGCRSAIWRPRAD